jgi:hypothetical protein
MSSLCGHCTNEHSAAFNYFPLPTFLIPSQLLISMLCLVLISLQHFATHYPIGPLHPETKESREKFFVIYIIFSMAEKFTEINRPVITAHDGVNHVTQSLRLINSCVERVNKEAMWSRRQFAESTRVRSLDATFTSLIILSPSRSLTCDIINILTH